MSSKKQGGGSSAVDCGGWAFFDQGLDEYKEMMLRSDWWYNVTVRKALKILT